MGFFTETIQALGYPGIFLINLLSAGTIFFPVPGYVLIVIFGGIFNPFLVALAAALGSALGESVGYGAGAAGRYLLLQKQEKYFLQGKKWFENRKGFYIIILFGATPLPFDAVGILSGVLRYNFKKFLIAAFIGKFIGSLILAFAGYYGIEWILQFLR